jgi:hypothetical protein
MAGLVQQIHAMTSFVPTSINMRKFGLPTDERSARVVVDYRVYTSQEGLYHRVCTDRKEGILPDRLVNWDTIQIVDYKLWRKTMPHSQRQRQDLDQFLMNTQQQKLLHVSIDDTDLYFSRSILEHYLGNLKWQGNLHLQIMDRGQRTIADNQSDWTHQYSMVQDFFSTSPLASLDYYQQSFTGNTGLYIDLLGSKTTQQYSHESVNL